MPEGGVIHGFSEVRQWTLPDFFSLEDEQIESPRFSLAGCTWFLRVFPKGYNSASKGFLSVFLCKDDPEIPEKKLTYALGLKKSDGSLKEKRLINNTFKIASLIYGWHQFFKLDDLQKRKSELAPSDALTFTCRVLMERSVLEGVSPNPEEADSSPRETMLLEVETLSSDLKDLLSSGRNCDTTLVVQGKEFKAHRALLSARSSVLGAMYEHDTSEAKSGVVTIPDCDPESFGDFLEFLYTGKTGNISFRTAYQLYATSEKYDVQQLKVFCTSCLIQNLESENVCDAVVLADRYDDDLLMSSAQAFFSKNFYSVFLTPEWTALSLKNDPRLANKLLKEMASAALKKT